VRGGTPRRITRAETASALHRFATFSADGRQLAYVACAGRQFTPCDIHLLQLGADYAPIGAPRRLTSQAVAMHGVSWTRDGRSLVYGTEAAHASFYLWRVPVDGSQPPERLEIAGAGARNPVTVLSRDRLGFTRSQIGERLYRFEPGGGAQPLLASSSSDYHAQFSPDGRRVAFSSTRAGETVEIWLAAADGSGPQPLTHGPGRWQGAPSWSPDGRRIAFDSQAETGRRDIWIIDAEGGTPQQLTRDSGDEIMPMWSVDGEWIYFSSDQGAGRDIWRARVAGAGRERLTVDGSGRFGLELGGTRSVVYQAGTDSIKGEAPLLVRSLSGGRPRPLVPCVQAHSFAVVADDVYYVPCSAGTAHIIHALDAKTGRDRVVGTLDNETNPARMAVSPDGTAFLVTRLRATVDLMLIENFR
jgi:Tol biopolymer transport system component